MKTMNVYHYMQIVVNWPCSHLEYGLARRWWDQQLPDRTSKQSSKPAANLPPLTLWLEATCQRKARVVHILILISNFSILLLILITGLLVSLVEWTRKHNTLSNVSMIIDYIRRNLDKKTERNAKKTTKLIITKWRIHISERKDQIENV